MGTEIKQSFCNLKTPLLIGLSRTCEPVLCVRDEEQGKGFFALCYLSLYLIRLLQQQLAEEGVPFSAEEPDAGSFQSRHKAAPES